MGTFDTVGGTVAHMNIIVHITTDPMLAKSHHTVRNTKKSQTCNSKVIFYSAFVLPSQIFNHIFAFVFAKTILRHKGIVLQLHAFQLLHAVGLVSNFVDN